MIDIKKLKPIILLGTVILFILLLGSLYYRFFVFHVLEISPRPSNYPSSSQVIEFKFNKPLAKTNQASQITIKPLIRHDALYEGDTLRIRLQTPPEANKVFTVTLNDIKNDEGESYSKTHSFSVRFVEFKKLSEEEQKRQIEESDSFESDYPLIDELPITTLNYSINYRYPDTGESKMPIIINMNFGPETDNPDGNFSNKDIEAYRQKIRTYRTEAIQVVKEKGYTTDRYMLLFGENELINEFEGTYVNERTGG